MTTQVKIDNWFKNAVGRGMNPDGMYGYQCKDVIDDYCLALFGNWTNTVRPGDAYVVFNNSNPAYFTKIANKPNSPNLIPQKGDIICWGKGQGDKYGHIAVVESADANGVNVIQQDGNINTKPAHRLRRSYWRLGVNTQGWLRPKITPVVTIKDETKREVIKFDTEHVPSDVLPLGEEKIVQDGLDGVRTIIYTVTYTDGKETSRKVKSDTTQKPINKVASVGTYVEPEPAPVEPGVPPVEEPDMFPDKGFLQRFIEWLVDILSKIIKR